MTVSNPEPMHPATPVPAVDAWAMEDEIDLREYVDVLVKWWREIVLLALAAAIVAALGVVALRLIVPPKYEATATVAIARITSDITFDERFRTQPEDQAQFRLTDANARRSALVGLVLNGAVAEKVIEEVGALLKDEEKDPSTLMEMVDARIGPGADSRSQSDLIEIKITADDPEKAAAIANAWARHYVEQVNAIYGRVPAELLGSVQTELEDAQQAYDKAQADLEAFMATSQIDRLTRLIAEKKQIIDSLQSGKQSAIQQVVAKEQEGKQRLANQVADARIEAELAAFKKDREARLSLFNELSDAQLRSVTVVFNQQVQEHIDLLKRDYQEKARLEQLKNTAQTLQAQVEAGGDTAAQSNNLAVLLLKVQVLDAMNAANRAENSPFTNLPVDLQLNVDSVSSAQITASQQLTDLASLVDVLETRLAELDKNIELQSQVLLNGEDYQFLDQLTASNLAVSSPISGTETSSPAAAASVNSLVDAIMQRYTDLFQVGNLVGVGQSLGGSEENPLTALEAAQIRNLVQLQGLESLPGYTEAADSLSAIIEKLDAEVQELNSQLESERSRKQQLTQKRDLSWSTFTTLSNKVAELNLANTAANSEVRFAAPAIPPADPVAGPSLIMTTALAGIVGLMLAVFIAFFANFMEQEPFLSRRRESQQTAG